MTPRRTGCGLRRAAVRLVALGAIVACATAGRDPRFCGCGPACYLAEIAWADGDNLLTLRGRRRAGAVVRPAWSYRGR